MRFSENLKSRTYTMKLILKLTIIVNTRHHAHHTLFTSVEYDVIFLND